MRLADGSPALRAAAEEQLRAQEALRLARREYFPDFALMGAYMNKEELLPEWELGVRVKIPLYFWRRQRAGADAASRQHIHQRSRHACGDAREVLHGPRHDQQHVCAGAMQSLATPQRLVEAPRAGRIGAPDDQKVRVAPRGNGGLDLGNHQVEADDVLDADVMVGPLR